LGNGCWFYYNFERIRFERIVFRKSIFSKEQPCPKKYHRWNLLASERQFHAELKHLLLLLCLCSECALTKMKTMIWFILIFWFQNITRVFSILSENTGKTCFTSLKILQSKDAHRGAKGRGRIKMLTKLFYKNAIKVLKP
jgi:hypothetical protein